MMRQQIVRYLNIGCGLVVILSFGFIFFYYCSSTTNEIINAKKPSILIPFPYAVDDHQYFNAKKLSEIKCSKVIRNENVNSVNLSLEAYRLLYFEKNSGYIRSKLSRIKTTNSSEQ